MSCKHYNHKLKKNERHYINSAKNNNCVLCLAENEGPMTQNEIGKCFGISKVRVNQIEKKALKKINRILYKMIN